MRSKSEETMDRIVKSIEEFFFIHHRSPSITEIANDISCSRSTIHAYLREMNQLGRLHYDGKTLETSVTQKADADFTLSPVLGSISCGQPEYAEEDFEEYVPLPVALFGEGDFFILRASGYSMIEAGIEPGDLVVVRKQNTPMREISLLRWWTMKRRSNAFTGTRNGNASAFIPKTAG